MAKKKRRWPRVDRDAFTVVTTFAEAAEQDRAYWHAQTPAARMRTLEMLRRINDGKAATGRTENVIEIVGLSDLT